MNGSQTHAAHPSQSDTELASTAAGEVVHPVQSQISEPSSLSPADEPSSSAAGPPAHWLLRVQPAGPPAHWVEKVREAAPHLLAPEVLEAYSDLAEREPGDTPPLPDDEPDALPPAPMEPAVALDAAPSLPAVPSQPQRMRVRAARLHQVAVAAASAATLPAAVQQVAEVKTDAHSILLPATVPPAPTPDNVDARATASLSAAPSVNSVVESRAATAAQPAPDATPPRVDYSPAAYTADSDTAEHKGTDVPQQALMPASDLSAQSPHMVSPSRAEVRPAAWNHVAPVSHSAGPETELPVERHAQVPFITPRKSLREQELRPHLSSASNSAVDAPAVHEPGLAAESPPAATYRAADVRPAPARKNAVSTPAQPASRSIAADRPAQSQAGEMVWQPPASGSAAHWPSLLDAQTQEPPLVEALLRAHARRQRLDREQRGDEWNV